MEEPVRSRLKWIFAGISAMLVGYVLYRRREAKRVADEQGRYVEREERLHAIADAMLRDGDPPPGSTTREETPHHPTH